MKTTLYLIRHSGPSLKTNILNTTNDFQITKEKYVLSVEAEKKAEKISEMEEFKNIDYIVSSHYVRSIETIKYIADKNNLTVDIDSSFDERKVGIARYEDMPENYYSRQKAEPTYKVGDGENQIEVNIRMTNAINKLLKEHKGERIVVGTHSTAISFFLINWCKLIKENDYYLLEYNGEIISKGKMNSPEVFELIFEDLELKSLKRITPNEL